LSVPHVSTPARRTGQNTTTGGASGYGLKSEDGENNWLYVDVDNVRDFKCPPARGLAPRVQVPKAQGHRGKGKLKR